ncbi:transposase [Streptomyces sp. NPDC057381]|uniref:transposase n=1 Tax=unclassified Streptomyces TaxID=2593676 RepID=UPI003642225B
MPSAGRTRGSARTVAFATKPALAKAMLQRAVAGGALFRWVCGDEVYGDNPALRSWLTGQRLAYVLAIGYKHRLVPRGQNARPLAVILSEDVWEIRSAGDGAHGLREYAWAQVSLPDREAADGFSTALLIRRHPATEERAYYLVHAPLGTPLAEIVRPAPAGQSRNASRPPRARPARTTARHATTGPGTGTSLALAAAAHLTRCGSAPAKRGKQPRSDPTERERDQPPAGQGRPHGPARGRTHPALVTLATPSPARARLSHYRRRDHRPP